MDRTEKINVRGVYFDNVTLHEAAAVVEAHMKHATDCMAVFTPNSEIVQNCIEDESYRALINAAELVVPDGIGVVKAARILNTPLKGKVAGIELGERTMELAARYGWRVYLLGGKPGIAELAAARMSEKYPGICFCGCRDGYFDKTGAENEQVKADIQASGAEVLYVCLGAPAQEKWIMANRAALPEVRLMLGLGGSLDGYAGTVKRAPKVFIQLGLEWFYRLLCDPSRIGRMMRLPKFYIGTWTYKLSRKK